MTTIASRPGPAATPGRSEPHAPSSRENASIRSDDLDPASRWDVEVALAVLTVAGLVGFHRVFFGSGWVVPVVGSALCVQIVCRLTRRYVGNALVAGVVDLVSVGALTAWTVLPSSTTYGLPLLGTWRAVNSSLMGVAERMQSATVPTKPLTGFLVLATLGAGIVSLAGSWIVFRLGRVLVTAVPSLAVFVACCSLGTRAGRNWSIVVEIVATAAFVGVAGVRSQAQGTWFASQRDGATRGGLRAGVPAVILAVAAAVVVAGSIPPADGHGLFGWRSQGAGAARGVFSPLVSLSTRLLPRESGTRVFSVESPVRSYWRLTSLDDFDGSSWSARDTYDGVDEKLPGVVKAPPGTRVVKEQIHIESLESVWLPLAFDPESVTGAGQVSYDARSDSLITPFATSDNLDYTVTSLQYLDTLSVHDLSTAPPLTHSDSKGFHAYEELPSSVSPRVRKLARTITAGARTEYARALALQQFFYGPQFTYSLHPPTDGSGNSALASFLFGTRTGYCQQFAGSYAVLARAIGLPTRLAVGFTSGRPVGRDGYQVTDADAHTWPEVWFPDYGWVPFEPTKGSPGHGFAIPGATTYTGNTADVRKEATIKPIPSTQTAPTTVPSSKVTTPTPSHPSAGSRQLHDHQIQSPVSQGVLRETTQRHLPPKVRGLRTGHLPLDLGLLAAGLAVWMTINPVGRRLRWARRRRAARRPRPDERGGAGAVLALWDESAERLAWRGVRRRASETTVQFAARVADERHLDGEIPLGLHLSRLAEILTAAEFGDRGVPGPDLLEAEARGAAVATILRRDRTHAERLRLLLDPRMAWAPVTVSPLGTVRAARS